MKHYQFPRIVFCTVTDTDYLFRHIKDGPPGGYFMNLSHQMWVDIILIEL